MPMIRCPIHGLTYVSLCCRHVAEAVDGGRMERAFVDIDGWTDTNVLCIACHERALAVIQAATAAGGDPGRFDFEFEQPMAPCCHDCLTQWYAKTGQGALSNAIADARQHAGLKPIAADDGTEPKR